MFVLKIFIVFILNQQDLGNNYLIRILLKKNAFLFFSVPLTTLFYILELNCQNSGFVILKISSKISYQVIFQLNLVYKRNGVLYFFFCFSAVDPIYSWFLLLTNYFHKRNR
jgi:hypothetical protein